MLVLGRLWQESCKFQVNLRHTKRTGLKTKPKMNNTHIPGHNHLGSMEPHHLFK
jgi:hypothetical protein